jgi:hypothetical protein
VQQQPADTGAVELLDVLPAGAVALEAVPEPTLRRLFAAFQLQVRYDKHANWATLQVTLHEDRLDELLAVAGAITDPQGPPAHGDGTAGGPPFAHAVPVPGQTTIGKPQLSAAAGGHPAQKLEAGFFVGPEPTTRATGTERRMRLQRGRSAWPALQQGGRRVLILRGIEHQILNLVLGFSVAQEATCHQTPGLATAARNCDHIATKPRVTVGDGCPSWTGDMAVDQDRRGHEGTRRRGRDG